jgi:hypothetical protein
VFAHPKDVCPAKNLILEKVNAKFNKDLPNLEDFCASLKSENKSKRVEAIKKFAKALDEVDNPANYFDDKEVSRLSEIQQKGVRLALRSLAYSNLYNKISPNTGSAYFLGASIMTMGILNMHSRFVTDSGEQYLKPALNKLTSEGAITDSITFGPLYNGNRQILMDFGIRITILSKCSEANPNLGSLNISEILHEAYPEKYKLKEDVKSCKESMSNAAQGKMKDWELKIVDCEQEMAEELMYNIKDPSVFSVATNTIFSTFNMKAPILSNNPNDLKFETLLEFWSNSKLSQVGRPVFANIKYRTPWLKRNLNMIQEVAYGPKPYDIDKLLDDEATQAALYIGPLMKSYCHAQIGPFIIHRKNDSIEDIKPVQDSGQFQQ